MKRLYIVLFASLLLTSLADGQSFYAARRERSLLLVAGVGTSTYFGDVVDDGHYIDAKPNITVGLQYYVNNRISLRSEATWFTLKGSDASSKQPEDGRIQRNLSFSSNNFEANFGGELSLFPQGARFYQRPIFNVYGFAGIGVMFFNPTATYQGQKYALQPLHTELVDYSRFGFVIPYGIGARIKVTPLFNVALEGGYRKTFTDYLDDVSTIHHDASKFTDPIAAALSDRRPEIGLAKAPDGYVRGNSSNKDSYFLLNVKVEYYLPSNFLLGNNAQKQYRVKRNSVRRASKRPGSGGLFKRKR